LVRSRRYVPRRAGGTGHGGLLVADGKQPVTVYDEKFYKWNIHYATK